MRFDSKSWEANTSPWNFLGAWIHLSNSPWSNVLWTSYLSDPFSLLCKLYEIQTHFWGDLSQTWFYQRLIKSSQAVNQRSLNVSPSQLLSPWSCQRPTQANIQWIKDSGNYISKSCRQLRKLRFILVVSFVVPLILSNFVMLDAWHQLIMIQSQSALLILL
jgi:hypothetical protein